MVHKKIIFKPGADIDERRGTVYRELATTTAEVLHVTWIKAC